MQDAYEKICQNRKYFNPFISENPLNEAMWKSEKAELLQGVPINIEKIDFLWKKCLTISRKKLYTKYRRNMMFEMRLKALAKINLGLDVLRRREDGYHEVKMVMQTIHLYDKIVLKKMKKSEIRVKTNLFYLPENENNPVYQAAKLLMDEFDIEGGIAIDLKKFIPVAAGMAGGSSDAAAVLFGMNRMFRLKLSRKELMERGVKIGADVPYCIMRGTALAEGIGEQLSVLPPMPTCKVLVAKPPISVSTKFVYENLKLDDSTLHPDMESLTKAIKEGDLQGIAAHMGNVLESVTIPNYPVIAQIKEEMIKGGALNAMMSGSGPTVFGLFQDEELARETYQKLRKGDLAKQVYLTDIYNNPASYSVSPSTDPRVNGTETGIF